MPPAAQHRRAAVALAMAHSLLASAAHSEELSLQPVSMDATALSAEPAAGTPDCEAGVCSFRFSAQQLLTIATRMVTDRKYDEAGPLVAALRHAPGMTVPYNFLEGMIALETGNPKAAARRFRYILKDRPGETRVRLELAKALLAQGDMTAADYHLRLAQNDEQLPEEIARAISNARSIIRSKRNWQFGFDFGLAPDTNINSATNAQTVDVNFGPLRFPLSLDEAARARSGTGLTASTFGSLRLPTSERTAIVADLDAVMVNYKGKQADDYSVQLAAGPEWRLGNRTSLSLQGVGLYRWYGGNLAARQFGAKLSLQHDLGPSQRIGLQLDGRHTDSAFGEGYRGWQLGGAATYEQVVAKSAIASISLSARRDFMKLAAFSNSSFGLNLGIGGELPLGVNAGVSGGVSHARYDEPQYFFSSERRKDWRYQARAYLGLRKIRVLGFSPSVEYQYTQVQTNYAIYRSTRHRVQFKLARYF